MRNISTLTFTDVFSANQPTRKCTYLVPHMSSVWMSTRVCNPVVLTGETLDSDVRDVHMQAI